MKRNFYLILMFLSLVAFRSSANRVISGTVYDQSNQSVMPGVFVKVARLGTATSTDVNGKFSISIPDGSVTLVFSFIGYESKEVKVGKSNQLVVFLKPDLARLNEVVVVGYGSQKKQAVVGGPVALSQHIKVSRYHEVIIPPSNSESYKEIKENAFLNPKTNPLSTFAIDVDAASYSNFRRFINNGQIPPEDAVRIEEMINYFKYDLKGPSGKDPVAIHTELSVAPWNTKHQLLRVALKAKEVETNKLPPSNLVFLVDVSRSMQPENKLPLVKSSLKMLVDQLREQDRVAVVTYAGNVGVQLPATPGNEKAKIKSVIDNLEAGGGTAGGAGLKMAYELARANFIKGGSNRIVMATDGDFNVGVSSDEEMEKLVSRERESGISISVLGFGMGNYKDSKMETIANKGHGNYAYIDNISEARKSMVSEFGGTLFTVAKDVKMQLEFNPAKVQAYRLIGYENRLLEKEDFNNDKKLGGDMGVGHAVTALYEIIPVGVKSEFSVSVDPLKYQKEDRSETLHSSSEIATIKFRYKLPDSGNSQLQQVTVQTDAIPISKASSDFRFASAVAELGMLVRNSPHKQNADYSSLISRAKDAKGLDEDGYRSEFIRLAESLKLLAKSAELSYENKENR